MKNKSSKMFYVSLILLIVLVLLIGCQSSSNTETEINQSSYETEIITDTNIPKTYKSTEIDLSDYNTPTITTSYDYDDSQSSKKTYIFRDSYDEGYDDIYLNEDYDEERYKYDSDYANGVDDAYEDWEDEDWE